MKLHLLAAAATVLAAPAAIAGPYVNVESNSGFAGSDYAGSVVEAHLGADLDLSDSASAYLQAGPAFVLPDDGETVRFGGPVDGREKPVRECTARPGVQKWLTDLFNPR